MVERHRLASQAFLPLSSNRFLMIVAEDLPGRPGNPLAFESAPRQDVNIA